MKRKISKKHLFLFLLICSIIGNVCLYMGKQRAEQKASDIADALREKQEALTEISNDVTEKEEPETAPDELSLTPDTNLPDIGQEIEEYRMHFIELYTSNAMEETEDRINIEETEIDYGDNGEPAALIKYTDLSGEKLRYQLQFYGETGRCSIDYYLCKDFLLISRKTDYYSSWVLTADYSDVLYSTVENWIVMDENVYVLHSDGELEKIEKTQLEVPTLEEIETTEYCSISDFEEMNYYLFCDSQLHLKGSGAGFTFRPVIIGSETKKIEEAKELYQEFVERLPLEPVKEGEENNVFYVSPDCKWVITIKWSELKHTGTQTLFYEKEKVREKMSEMGVFPILIVKDGDSYREMDEEHYEKLSEMDHIVFYDGGYDDLNKINAEGNLLAGIQDDYTLLSIREIEDGTEQWSFSLQGIREEMARIRDDVEDGDRVFVSIQQFEGNEKEGWLTVQAENSSFFRIAYPSGEVTYLGEYLYAVSFSPDGKYAAYSSEEDYDSGVGMTQEEYERVRRTCPPGICVREIETGKTAFIYWYPFRNPEEDGMEYRHFLWIEKEGFEEYMGGS